LYERLRLGVAELRLGLALELRLRELHRHDRGEPFANVFRDLKIVLVVILANAANPHVSSVKPSSA